MAVTITKAKPKAVTKHNEAVAQDSPKTLAEMSIEQLADRYGTLQDQVQAARMNPVFTQFSEVEEELKRRLKDFPPETGVDIQGEHFTLEVGACRKCPDEVKDIMKVRQFLGEKTFMALISITLANLKKYLNPEQYAQVMKTDVGYTETRAIKTFFRG